MQVFLSHHNADKDRVEPIGTFLKDRGLTVWLDSWCMTAGDSLIEKIGDGIEVSDRLVVCLTPSSVESNWVRKEVATGLVMELAEEKGLGGKFVIPALLVPCKVPIMLRDKLFANFTNKAFSAACEELLAGITDTAQGSKDSTLDNRIVRKYNIRRRTAGKHTLVIEFAARISPTEGLHVGVDVGALYTRVLEWFGPPEHPEPPPSVGGVYTDSARREEPPIYARKFSSPGVTSTRSFYLLFEGDFPFNIKDLTYQDFYNRIP
jgi:hypothetical protein